MTRFRHQIIEKMQKISKCCMKVLLISLIWLQQNYVLKLKLLSLQQQARRVYEILRLRITDRTDVNMYRDYRIDVKNRLNIPHQVNHVLLFTFSFYVLYKYFTILQLLRRLNSKKVEIVQNLIRFLSIISFYILWKRQKTFDFWLFPAGIKWDYWSEMGK